MIVLVVGKGRHGTLHCAAPAAIDGQLLPERGPLDAGGEQRRFALVVGDRGRLALGAEQVERDALPADERHELVGGVERTRLVNSHLPGSISLTLNSQVTWMVVRPFGVNTSEVESRIR